MKYYVVILLHTISMLFVSPVSFAQQSTSSPSPPPDVTKFDSESVQMYLSGLWQSHQEQSVTIESLKRRIADLENQVKSQQAEIQSKSKTIEGLLASQSTNEQPRDGRAIIPKQDRPYPPNTLSTPSASCPKPASYSIFRTNDEFTSTLSLFSTPIIIMSDEQAVQNNAVLYGKIGLCLERSQTVPSRTGNSSETLIVHIGFWEDTESPKYLEKHRIWLSLGDALELFADGPLPKIDRILGETRDLPQDITDTRSGRRLYSFIYSSFALDRATLQMLASSRSSKLRIHDISIELSTIAKSDICNFLNEKN